MDSQDNSMRKFKIPSLGAILHFIVIEVASQIIWYGVSQMITNVWVKDIGILVVFVASIFAVAWYLPKLSSWKIYEFGTNPKKSKLIIDKPESLIFPYIQSVNASPLMNGKNILSVWYCFPSAFPDEIKYMTVMFHAIINGTPTNDQPRKPLRILGKQYNDISELDVVLDSTFANNLREQLKNHAPMKIKLVVTCWDDNKKEHDLSTKELTLFPLW